MGFAVAVPAREASLLSRQVGEQAFLHTYLHVREDALQLFGFSSPRSRAFFLSLIAVSGVGPKVALAILSTYPVEELEAAVVRGDAKKFESIPGIGKKLAQRLMIELKDKVCGRSRPRLSPAARRWPRPTSCSPPARALQGLGLTPARGRRGAQGRPSRRVARRSSCAHALRKKDDG